MSDNAEKIEEVTLSHDWLVEQMNLKLYGPSYCPNCDAVTPTQVYQKQGSFKIETTHNIDGSVTMKASYTGSKFCSKCHIPTSQADQDKE